MYFKMKEKITLNCIINMLDKNLNEYENIFIMDKYHITIYNNILINNCNDYTMIVSPHYRFFTNDSLRISGTKEDIIESLYKLREDKINAILK